jgi:hypothetical protein
MPRREYSVSPTEEEQVFGQNEVRLIIVLSFQTA